MRRILRTLIALAVFSVAPCTAPAQFQRETALVAIKAPEHQLLVIMSHAIDASTNGEPRFVAFSSDGKRLFVGGCDGRVPLAPVAKDAEPRFREGNVVEEAVRNTIEDGSQAKRVPSVRQSGTVGVFRVEDGKLLQEFRCTAPNATVLDSCRSARLSPDGKFLALIGMTSGGLYILDSATGRQLGYVDSVRTEGGPAESLRLEDLAFLADSQQLLTLDKSDRRILLHRVPSGQIVDSISVRDDAVAYLNGLDVSRDGKTFAYGPTVWDAKAAKLLRTSKKRSRSTSFGSRVKFSPDGRVVLGIGDWKLNVWGEDVGQPFESGVRACVNDVAFSPDGRLMVIARGDCAEVWSYEGRKMLGELKGHLQDVARVAFSPDGRRLATVSRDASTRLWDVSGFAQSP